MGVRSNALGNMDRKLGGIKMRDPRAENELVRAFIVTEGQEVIVQKAGDEREDDVWANDIGLGHLCDRKHQAIMGYIAPGIVQFYDLNVEYEDYKVLAEREIAQRLSMDILMSVVNICEQLYDTGCEKVYNGLTSDDEPLLELKDGHWEE